MIVQPNPISAKLVTISARLDRLPPTPYLRGLIARIAVGGWFEFFDLFMTAYVSLGLIKAGIFTATTAGLFDRTGFAGFVASGFAGMFIGTLVLGGVSDRYGRKTTFMYSLFCYSIATLVMAFQKTPISLDLCRFVAGLGIGVQLITINAYISEISPKESRGRYTSFSLLISYCAVPFAAFAAYVLIPRTFLGLDGWRWLTMIGALGAPIYLLIGSQLPESPRWYEARGRKEEAEAAVAQIEAAAEASLRRPLPPPQAETSQSHATGGLHEIWGEAYRARTVMLVIFNIFQTVGFYGFASWVPLLLIQQGVSFVHSLEYTFAIAIVNPLGPLISMTFADTVQRKWQIVSLAIASAAFGTVFARMRNPALIILFGALITVANNWFSCAFHSYQAELYPTRIHDATKPVAKAKVINELRAKLRSKLPPFGEFEARFLELRYSAKFTKQKNLVRYILTRMTQHNWTGIPIDSEKMTIEHLSPENPPKPIGLSDEQVALIGNLILVDQKLNNKLGAKNFSDKIKILKRADVRLDDEIRDAASWAALEIETTNKAMAAKAYNDIWKF